MQKEKDSLWIQHTPPCVMSEPKSYVRRLSLRQVEEQACAALGPHVPCSRSPARCAPFLGSSNLWPSWKAHIH